MCRVTGIRLERLGSPSGPVQRQHVQPARPVPQRFTGPQRDGIGQRTLDPALRQQRRHAVLQAFGAQLVDADRLGRHPVVVGEVLEQPATRQCQGRVGGGLRPGPVAGSHRVPGVGAVCGEVDEVDGAAVGDRKVVTGSLPDDRRGHAPLAPQCLAQVGDIGLQARGGAARDVVAPHRVDQPVHRHHAAIGEQQRGQYGALLGRAQVYPAPVVRHLQGAQ